MGYQGVEKKVYKDNVRMWVGLRVIEGNGGDRAGGRR